MHMTGRRAVAVLVLPACGLVLLHGFVLEPFRVPTGSMAPALVGVHRTCDCPRCGFPVQVGEACSYRKAYCPNCGHTPVPLAEAAAVDGDQVLVNKTVFALRRPRRWEIVVFRWLGSIFIKRLTGLPGEEVTIRDGDIYIDGRLARKTFDQARAMRVLIYDHGHAPPGGWAARWACEPASAAGDELYLDGRATPATRTYHHFSLDELKSEPITDEHAYNAGGHAGREPVHDFAVEANIEVLAGMGSLKLRLYDGQDTVEVEVPVGRDGRIATRLLTPSPLVGEGAGKVGLRSGQRHNIEMALVDRRLSVAIDDQLVLTSDLPEPGPRAGVTRPVQVEAVGAAIRLRGFKLWRDVHYGRRGVNAVAGESVRLGADQYFVLGDNSPNSEDSRFWPDRGRVSGDGLIGAPVLVHLPSRRLALPGGAACQVPDVARIRRPR